MKQQELSPPNLWRRFSAGNVWNAHFELGDELLPQVDEFKYLEVLFTTEGRAERGIDRQIGVCSDEDAILVWCVEDRAQQERKLTLLPVIPALTSGQELWVVTRRIRVQI